MKYQGIVVTILLALFVTACASAPAAVTEAPAAMPTTPPTTAPTEPPVEPTTAQPEPATAAPAATGESPAPTEAAPAVTSAVIYRIVPGESSASYEVGETFLDQNRFATAIGVTPEINGEITLDTANPQTAQIGVITVDVSQLTSDSSRRDGALRDRFLLSSQFPTVTFAATGIEGLPATYTEGQDISFKVTGDLTVQQTVRPITFDVTARVAGGVLSGSAVSMIKMSDFGIGPISLAMLRTEDDVKLTFNFVARP